MLERDVKRSAIDACLSTRNDFQALTVAAVYDRQGRAVFISVASRNNVRALDHQDHCSLRCAWAMAHAFGNNKALPRAEIDNTIFKVDEEISIENEKEFINVLVLMPVVLTLHYCHPDDGVVDLAKRLIVPLVRARIGQFLHIDQLEWSVQDVEVSLIWKILRRFVSFHDQNLTAKIAEVAGKDLTCGCSALSAASAVKTDFTLRRRSNLFPGL
jgi:hypothetical protein